MIRVASGGQMKHCNGDHCKSTRSLADLCVCDCQGCDSNWRDTTVEAPKEWEGGR